MSAPLRIGTRASKLALAQAEMLRAALASVHPGLEFEIVAMTTAGDRELHKQLTDWGYKGLFTKELEDALLEDKIDIAVHSMKDMPSILPAGLTIAATLKRADVRDAWVSPIYPTLNDMPQGAVVGSSSARRIAQLLHRRPDIQIVPLRGNVQTRLRKLEEGVASATFLAAAGLHRLGIQDVIRHYMPLNEMLPAVAQGAIGVECKEARPDLIELLAPIHHRDTFTCLTAERAFLLTLDGSCRTPIAGLAQLRGERIFMEGEVLSLDGTVRHYHSLEASAGEAAKLGAALGEELRARAGEGMLKHA